MSEKDLRNLISAVMLPNYNESLKGILRAILLQNFIRAGNRIIDQIKISVTAKGLFVSAMDESHICLISFSIPAEAFMEYGFAGKDFEFALDVEKGEGIVKAIPTPARKKPTKKMIKEGKESLIPRNYFIQLNAEMTYPPERVSSVNELKQNMKKALKLSEQFTQAELEKTSDIRKNLKNLPSLSPQALIDVYTKFPKIELTDASESKSFKEFAQVMVENQLIFEKIKKISGDIVNILQTDVAKLKLPATMDWDEEKIPPVPELDIAFDRQGELPTRIIRNAIMLAEAISDTLEIKIDGQNLLLGTEVENDIFEYSIPIQFEGKKMARGVFSLSFLKNLFGAKDANGALSDTAEFRIFLEEKRPLKITAKIGSPEDTEKLPFMAFLAPRVVSEESYYEEDEPVQPAKEPISSEQMVNLERREDLNLPPLTEYARLEEIEQLFESPGGLVILSQFKRPDNPNLLKRWDEYFSDCDILLIKGDQCEVFTKQFFEEVIKLIAQKAGGDSSTFSKSHTLLIQFLKRDPSLNRILSLMDKTEWFIPLMLDGVSVVADFLAESKERESDIELTFPKARWKHEFKREKLRISVNEFDLLFPTFIACAKQIRGITEQGILAIEKLKARQLKTKRNLIWNSSAEHVFELIMPMDDRAISALEKAQKIIKMDAILADNSFDFRELLESIKPEFEVPISQLRPIIKQWQNNTIDQTSREDLAKIVQNIDKLIETCQNIGPALLFGDLIVDYLQILRKQATFVESLAPEQQTFDPSALIDDLNSFVTGTDLIDVLLERLDNVVFWSQMGSSGIRTQDKPLIQQIRTSIGTFMAPFVEKYEKKELKNLEPLAGIFRDLGLNDEQLIPLLPRIIDEIKIIFGKFRLGQPLELLPSDIDLATAEILLLESTNRLKKVSQKATLDLIEAQVRNLEAFQLDIRNFRSEIVEKINKSTKDPLRIREMWDKVFALIEIFAKNTTFLKQHDPANKWPYENEQNNFRSELRAIEKIFDALADFMNEFLSPIASTSDSFSARISQSDFMSLAGMIRALKSNQEKGIKYQQLDAWRKN